ncbi:MAG: bifunctional hydroxymethylpyrimidine kinase/phosphomethylpyrimidine kinase [Hyphomicrobiales bacterium]|nr:bifunctional hydroxymethylpyrimidine kinase/phosphomethylpyrimidine kinase [Hyphomicrobiales bacterium]
MSVDAQPSAELPVAVTIAGSDSGGGAGIQADIKTFSALGVFGASVITALTAQNTREIAGIFDVPGSFVTRQIDAVYSDLPVMATKIGMLARNEVVVAVAEGLHRFGARRVVLDPVMLASSGTRLLSEDAVESLVRLLFPLADLVTPNIPETAALLGEDRAADEDTMARQGERLMRLGARAVLIKGGHAGGAESVDLLIDEKGVSRHAAPRIAARNTHGTGCTLSSAIAAGLAKGQSLEGAVRSAKLYLTAALAAADRLKIGSGKGPVHHFHRSESRERTR